MFSQVPFALFAGLNSHDRIQQKKGKKSKKRSNQTENRINFFLKKDQFQFHGKEANPCGRVMRDTKFPLHEEIKPHPFTSEPRAHRHGAENGEIKSGGEASICAKGNPGMALSESPPNFSLISLITGQMGRNRAPTPPWAAPQGEGWEGRNTQLPWLIINEFINQS